MSEPLHSGPRVCVAGLTGWTGQAVARAVHAASDMTLVSGVSRQGAGQDAGLLLDTQMWGVPVHKSVDEALQGADILVDYTSYAVIRSHVSAALDRGVAVVVGTSGLTAQDFQEIDEIARTRGVGVIAAGNYSLTAALMSALAQVAAGHLHHWEVIDYASDTKPDAPSGTARELAERLAANRMGGDGEPAPGVDERSDAPGARGADIAGTPVHSLRLPGFSLSTEVVFGLPGERLTIRHDAGESAAPYVVGTMLAIRKVGETPGLTRGLDALLLSADRDSSVRSR